MLERFDGSDAFVQRLGDLSGGQARPQTQHQHPPLLLRQALDRFPDPLDGHAGDGPLLGSQELRHALGLLEALLAPPRQPPGQVDGPVVGDPEQPSLEGGGISGEPADPSHRLEEDLTREILGVLAASGLGDQVGKDRPREDPIDLVERPPVAGPGPGDRLLEEGGALALRPPTLFRHPHHLTSVGAVPDEPRERSSQPSRAPTASRSAERVRDRMRETCIWDIPSLSAIWLWVSPRKNLK